MPQIGASSNGVAKACGASEAAAKERQKDAVGACYHALGADSSGAAAVETWGEEGTPGKKNTDWQEPFFAANPTFPGLTADAVWDCSTRDINRGYKLAMWDPRGKSRASERGQKRGGGPLQRGAGSKSLCVVRRIAKRTLQRAPSRPGPGARARGRRRVFTFGKSDI